MAILADRFAVRSEKSLIFPVRLLRCEIGKIFDFSYETGLAGCVTGGSC